MRVMHCGLIVKVVAVAGEILRDGAWFGSLIVEYLSEGVS